MVAVASQIKHETNFVAHEQLQISIGSDRVVRVNVDGICAIRVRMAKLCELELDNLLKKEK